MASRIIKKADETRSGAFSEKTGRIERTLGRDDGEVLVW